jgi:hypothetical protein
MSLTKKTNSKPSTFHIVITLWLIFSAGYIVYDLWKDGLNATYNLGRASAFTEVVSASQSCQPFSVGAANANTELISIPCLEQAQQQAQQQAQGGATGAVAPAVSN